jgi:hypothetical protein
MNDVACYVLPFVDVEEMEPFHYFECDKTYIKAHITCVKIYSNKCMMYYNWFKTSSKELMMLL